MLRVPVRGRLVYKVYGHNKMFLIYHHWFFKQRKVEMFLAMQKQFDILKGLQLSVITIILLNRFLPFINILSVDFWFYCLF